MAFVLEALQAEHGDALLLHAGSHVVLVDGGPEGVYEATLKPRLQELAGGGPLRLPLVIVSHIDDDHLIGVLRMLEDLEAGDRVVEIGTIWHNAFQDLLPTGLDEAAVSAAEVEGGRAAAVVASARTGRELDRLARRLGLTLNRPFEGLVRAPADPISVGPLSLHVLAPDQDQLDKLEEDWREELAKNPKPPRERVAAFTDRSASNLSSMVVLAECDGKRILLTGDARGDGIARGLERAALSFDAGSPLDVLKVPHHGSKANVKVETFRALPARHYVFSANGKHHNPDVETLEMLTEAREDDDFTLWFTNRRTRPPAIGEAVQAKLDADRAAGRRYDVVFREDASPSLTIEL